MPYPILDIEVTEPLPDVPLPPSAGGVAVVLRRKGHPVRFWMGRRAAVPGGRVTPAFLEEHVVRPARGALVAEAVREELRPPGPPLPLPPLTVAICTHDRPDALARCLRALAHVVTDEVREVLVVDNAPSDGRTRAVAEAAGVRYALEPRPGLDFARNRALAEAEGELLTFFDDDTVVDRGWLDGLRAAHAEHPDAAAFTGLVLPLVLETPAQILFEERGGFRYGADGGFHTVRYGPSLAGSSRYPAEAGLFGVGANMTFRRSVLLELGGFDEALDTGAPLPGGGDLDVFYRVVRAGHPLVYEPRCLVFHEHRRDMAGLRRQYWSWGLGFTAFAAKAWAADREARPEVGAAVRWWARHQRRELAAALRRPRTPHLPLVLAEIRGGVAGLLGGYARSQRRTAQIRADHA